MRWLRREAFRTHHLGYRRVNVVSHSWGEAIGAAVLALALVGGVFVFIGKTIGFA